MSESSSRRTTSTFSDFEQRFQDVLATYNKETGKDLLTDPLASDIYSCDSPDAILAVLRKALALDGLGNDNSSLYKWLQLTVRGLYALPTSSALGAGIRTGLFPSKVILSALGVLLDTIKSKGKSYDVLVNIFESIGGFIVRLKIYSEIPPTPAVAGIVIEMTVEILSALTLAIKQVHQGQFNSDVVLQRLDMLTLKEIRMTAAPTLEVVYGLLGNTKSVVGDVTGPQLRRDIQCWLSAPDPWTNHNFARKTCYNKTKPWFTESDTFNRWMSSGSLLWIYGIPGSGKSILCSTVIEAIQQTGSSTLAFFYFDRQDAAKQDVRGLLAALLIQLGDKADDFFEVLSSLYSTHQHGAQQPSEEALTKCLTDMMNHSPQLESPVYIIIDGLDCCPNSYPSTSREQVLKLMKVLINLHTPHLRLCVTSRLEIDIRHVLKPLAANYVSLHNEPRQTEDIERYVQSVVDSDIVMREWPEKDKHSVIDKLATHGGMFQWASCQLEILRRCPLQSVRRALSRDLSDPPRTLDETYERVLQGIDVEKREYAYRIFQCLTVATRPLRVEELAEVFAIQVDVDAPGIPKFDVHWRPVYSEDALLSACSSLITVIDFPPKKQTVEFCHLSVQQFLTSDRIKSSKHVSNFHIPLEPAHTFLAKACLSILFQLDDDIDGNTPVSPLAPYAANHWAYHARSGNMSPTLMDGIERLFDIDKPHFEAWIQMYDMDDASESPDKHRTNSAKPDAVPLYYAALCGLNDITQRLLDMYPQDVNARGDRRMTPLHAALEQGHVEIVKLLLDHGADVDSRDSQDRMPLHVAAEHGNLKAVQLLIDRLAPSNAEDAHKQTPLSPVSKEPAPIKGGSEVLQDPLSHGADVDPRDSDGSTPLHMSSAKGHYDVVLCLLEHEAEPDSRDNHGSTPLHHASQHGHMNVVRLLLDYDADFFARNKDHHTFLELAWKRGEQGPNEIADANARYSTDQTALHFFASRRGEVGVMRSLIERGALVDAENEYQETPLFPASRNGNLEATDLLLDHKADVNHRDWEERTPLHAASEHGHHKVSELLLEHKANVDAANMYKWTPLHLASRTGKDEVAKVLLERGAKVDVQNDLGWTPLHMASRKGHLEVVKLLLEHPNSNAVNAQKADRETALHLAAYYGHLEVVRALLDKGAKLDIENTAQKCPEDLARDEKHHQVEQLLKDTAVVRKYRLTGEEPVGIKEGRQGEKIT